MAVQWHKVYHELAKLLADFYKQDPGNAAKRFAELSLGNKEIVDSNRWLPKVIENLSDFGIDPIQLFAHLSEPQAGADLRTRRVAAFLSAFGGSEPGEIDFTGCPTLLTIKVSARRSPSVQQEIWQLLANVAEKGRGALTREHFDNLKGWYGVNITSLTVFLFWIDAENFPPMDQNTVRFLEQSGLIKGRPKNFSDYQAILINTNITDYPLISARAKSMSLLNPGQLESEAPVPPNKQRTKKPEQAVEPEERQQISGCRLLAIRVYNTTDEKWRKVLKKNGQIYSFYKAFQFKEVITKFNENNDAEIKYDPIKDVPLYQEGKLETHVSAIVGENGSGKSTLTELIFLAINNFTIAYSSIPNNLLPEYEVYVDLYFITDALYKLSVQGSKFLLKRYRREDDFFRIKEDVMLLEFDFERFFYSIVTNYALYALNSRQIGEWIGKLFHKNDQYQVPINISPFRKAGNIDINRENGLVKTRLVANLLLPVDQRKNKKDTIRQLTASKAVEKLRFKLQENKFKTLFEYPEGTDHYFNETEDYWYDVLLAIKTSFDIKQELPAEMLLEPKNYTEANWMYLLKKVISICMTYPAFEIYFNAASNTFNKTLLPDLMTELRIQKSHVTHKFYQAIHFFTADHFKLVREEADMTKSVEYDLDELSKAITQLVIAREDKQIKIIHYAPPAFLNITIMLTGNTNFKNLSSGEKQRIYSVSSVVYHLLNIDSNADQEELVRYNAATIIFDEVELYFHPEMQRSFVKFLLDYLNRLELDVITSVNILFITHSPFILSDIPADNILFLGETEANIKTFAANIHNLLADSFFLKDSFMGEYAQEVINDLISYLIDQRYERKWTPDKAEMAINAIGEPLLKDRLEDIFIKKFDAVRTLDQKMRSLKHQLNELENEKNRQR